MDREEVKLSAFDEQDVKRFNTDAHDLAEETKKVRKKSFHKG
jgi:hypothetical protein